MTKAYLKQITKKQLKALKDNRKNNFEAIKKGMDEITLQYERLLKHLRIHSEVFVDIKEVLKLSVGLKNTINTWLEDSSREVSEILKVEEKQDIPLTQLKDYYDKILNLDTCRCLLGFSPIEKHFKKRSVSAFDRFSVYFEFWQENLTQKFTKSNIDNLYNSYKVRIVSPNAFTNDELEFFKRKDIDPSNLKTRWAWVNNKKIAVEFYKEVVLPKFDSVPKAHDVDNIGYRGFRASIKRLGIGMNDITKAAGFNPYFEIKYANMNYNEIINFYHKTIIPDFKLKYPNDIKSYLRQRLVMQDYRGFIDRLYKLVKSAASRDNIWANFLRKNGFEPLKEFQYKSKSFSELLDLFVKEIYPNLKKKYNLGQKQAPLKEQLDDEFNGFRKAIRRLGYSLSDLYIVLGFKQKFWKIYDNKSYMELLNFYKEIIHPSLQEIYDFSDTEAPSYEEVEINFRGFIQALIRHGKHLSNVNKTLGYTSRKFANLGVITHSVMNLLLSYYINNKNFPSNYYSEVELFSSSKHRIDGFLFVTTSLISLFNKQVKKLLYSNLVIKKEREEIISLLRKIEGKQHLLIDFSNGFFKRRKINSEIIGFKAKKYLDYPSSFLILIGTNWSNLELRKRLPNAVKYKDSYYNTTNIALINPKLFGILIGINGKYKDLLNKTILYSKREDIDKLQGLNKSLERIKDINYFSTEEFNKIKENNTLIKWL